MSFLKKFLTFGDRSLARNITKEIAKIYLRTKKENPESSKDEILKKTLSQLNYQAAKELLGVLEDDEPANLNYAIYYVVTGCSPVNKKKLFIPLSNVEAYTEEIKNVLDEYGLSNE
jgi:hypothetical protein